MASELADVLMRSQGATTPDMILPPSIVNARQNWDKHAPEWSMEPGSMPGWVRIKTGNDPAIGNFNYHFLADQKGGRDVDAILRSLLENR